MSPTLDYQGARGSNAGDDFHEWWALRQSLTLLDPNANLSYLTVEGVSPNDASGTTLDTWEGVDCTLYFAVDDADNPERIIIEQLKYSGPSPTKPWTVPRLKYYPPGKKDNSIIKKLAVAYLGLVKKWPHLADKGNIIVLLVSNQPLGKSITNAVKKQKSQDYLALRKASGLGVVTFKKFALSLDFSHCGTASRFGQEESAISAIARVVEGNVHTITLALKDRIHRLMLPEGAGHIIDKEKLISWMMSSDITALFPCESEISQVDNPVEREAASEIVTQMLQGSQFICLHGEGGCGKTTVIQQIQDLLPESHMIVFDCYGAGHYQESDAYRH